jgi:peptidoglycan DL-endopeptidase LytE
MRQTSRIITFLTLFTLLPSAAQASSYTYVVSAGDTLSKIAREHQTTVDDIMQFNQLATDELSIGQTITLTGTSLPEVVSTTETSSSLNENPDLVKEFKKGKKARVVADVVNVRQSPSLEGEIVGKLYDGSRVELLEPGMEWTKIRFENDEAFVASEFLKISDRRNDDDDSDDKSDKKLEDLEEIAEPLIGIPYVLGGTTTRGFDCSGFTSYVFDKMGINLPRTSEEQFLGGESVSLEDARPGDLIFYDALNKGRVSHVAIYLGDGRIVHAGGDDVNYQKLEYMHKLYPFYGVKRYLD